MRNKSKTNKPSPSLIFRKQVTFPEEEHIEVIGKAVDMLNHKDEFGGKMSVNHFIAKTSYNRALQLLEDGE